MATRKPAEINNELEKEFSPIGEEIDLDIYNTPGALDDISPALFDEEIEDYEGTEKVSNLNCIDEEMAATILKTPFEITAAILNEEHWKLTDSETNLMKLPASRVFSELFGKYVDTNPDAYILGFTLITCVGLRAGKSAAIKKQKAAEEETIVPVPDVKEGY